MTPLQIAQYYANLLIYQYLSKTKAYSTIFSTVAPLIMPQVSVQSLTFSDIAASGTFVLQYNGNNTSTINWNDNATTIQSNLRALSGLSSVTVIGSIASQSLTVTFTGVIPPTQLLILESNSLVNSLSEGIAIGITEIDQTIPLQVQNAFNLVGSSPATGVQLDILGKYVGVTRFSNGPFGPITLDDSDFLTLIKFAVVQNNSGSSLSDIENNLNTFFPGQFIVTDFQNMDISYILSSSLGSTNLFISLVVEGLLPRPMAVGITVFIPPDINSFFGFRTYDIPSNNAKPFNTYDDFNLTWIWLSYSNQFLL